VEREKFVEVVQLSEYFVSVVVRAVVPVVEQSCVKELLWTYSLASGKLETFVEVVLIHKLKVIVDPDRITPAVPGTPDGVGNWAIMKSPGLKFLMSWDKIPTAAVSGPVVKSCMPLESSWRWYVVCAEENSAEPASKNARATHK